MFANVCQPKSALAKSAIAAVFALSIQSLTTSSAVAQEATEPQNDAVLSELLAGGYQIQAMQYLPRSMVFTLQNGASAYVCETNLDGQNTICVELE